MDWMTAAHDHTLTYTVSGIGCNDRKKMLWLQLKQIINLIINNIAEASNNILLPVLQAVMDNLILEFLPQEPYVQCFSHTYDHVPP